MIGGVRPWLATLLLAFAGWSAAQDGRVAFASSGPVAFAITPEAYAAAGACPGCQGVPPEPGAAIILEVTRQNPNRLYTIDVLHDGWSPAVDLALEARYTVTSTGSGSVLLATGWMPIDAAPASILTQAAVASENRVRVEVAYRLLPHGREPAGDYATRVTYRVRENGVAVTHDVRVAIPSFLTLRVVGRTADVARTAVSFDYADAPTAYLTAVTFGTPLPPTASDLLRLEVATNHPLGYTVTARVDETLAPAGAPSLRHALLLAGAQADGRTFVASGPTDGFVTLATGEDFGLRVDGGEAPGPYLFVVRYEAARNP